VGALFAQRRMHSPEEVLEALWTNTYVNPKVLKKYILGNAMWVGWIVVGWRVEVYRGSVRRRERRNCV
jgi:hypothetical protein